MKAQIRMNWVTEMCCNLLKSAPQFAGYSYKNITISNQLPHLSENTKELKTLLVAAHFSSFQLIDNLSSKTGALYSEITNLFQDYLTPKTEKL